MLKKQIDILAIGDMVTDAFIRLHKAEIHCKINHEDCEICLPFGDKIPFEYVKVVRAVGNAANAAVASARLGLKTAFVSDIGDDQNGKECLETLQRDRVITSLIKTHKNKPTNYHFVLWYENDRTILVNHQEYDYHFPLLEKSAGGFAAGRLTSFEPKWVYLSSLASNTLLYHMEIADWLDSNPKVKLAFQPGTFQMQFGIEKLKRIYSRTDFFVVNVEEAQRILGSRGIGFRVEGVDNTLHPTPSPSRDIKSLLKGLADLGPRLVAITDNTDGAYLFDGERYYQIPMYPDPRPAFERTGCGDAWASTFVSALAMGKPPLEALVWAPVNPMSVAQFIGAQEGLLTLDQLEWWLKRAPADFKPKEI